MFSIWSSRRAAIRSIRQSTLADCGLACVAMIASAHGCHVSMLELLERFPPGMRGMSLRNVMTAFSSLGFEAAPISFEPDALDQLRLPAILHWRHSHFVVLTEVTPFSVTVLDPERGRCRYGIAEVRNLVTGVALEVSPTSRVDLARKVERVGNLFRPILDEVRNLQGDFLRVTIVALCLEAMVVAVPMLLAKLFNLFAVKATQSSALIIISAMLVATGTMWVLRLSRSLFLIHLSTKVKLSFVSKLVPRLLAMPYRFFEERSTADVMYRLGGAEHIRNIISDDCVGVIADAVMGLAILLAVAFLSVKVALVTLIGVVMVFVLKLLLSSNNSDQLDDIIRSRGAESQFVFETVLAARAIKLFNREAERAVQWTRHVRKTLSHEVQHAQVSTYSHVVPSAIADILVLCTLIFGLERLQSPSATIGTIFAIYVYQKVVFDRCLLVGARLVQFRMLSIFLDRLAELRTAREPSQVMRLDGEIPAPAPKCAGGLDVQSVSYRFAGSDVPILTDISLFIEPGEFVAIRGQSGVGKSTLIGIILGVRKPDSGSILWSGVPLDSLDGNTHGLTVAAVTQEDIVMTGTIEENITFFSDVPDVAKMQRATKMAEMEAEVTSMPLQYSTNVGHCGCALSGGQRQRLLIARALYAGPKVLIVDEGTSELDPITELRLYSNLKLAGVTLLVVAHRFETIKLADRVFELYGGRLVECDRTVSMEWPAKRSNVSLIS
jgi:ATP-binding cassette subfamily B protein RaxB